MAPGGSGAVSVRHVFSRPAAANESLAITREAPHSRTQVDPPEISAYMGGGEATSSPEFGPKSRTARPFEAGILPWPGSISIIAGSLEVAWTYAMKLSEGFTRPWPTLVMPLYDGASLGLLTIAVRTLPLGNRHAVWTSIGRLAPSSLRIAAPRAGERHGLGRGGPDPLPESS